jgi:hypothetical protein
MHRRHRRDTAATDAPPRPAAPPDAARGLHAACRDATAPRQRQKRPLLSAVRRRSSGGADGAAP